MTDEEVQQLEMLAQAVLDGRENLGELFDHLSASDVLALIQRVRKAEGRVQALEDSTLGEALKAAERRGAEEERERWMNAGRSVVGPFPNDP